MPFETILNVLWVCLASIALGVLGWVECSRHVSRRPVAPWRRILAVVFAVIFLFPCVSASDDLLSFHDLQFTLETRGELGNPLSHRSNDERPAGLHLARLFESLQNFQLLGLYLLLLTLCCFGLISSVSRPGCERYLLARSGRAPPVSGLA